jgi:hypothetical protein
MKCIAFGFCCAAVLSLAGCATPKPAETNVKPVTQTQIDSAIHDALKSGFRAKLLHGDTLYCREESHIGTHFTSTDCYTTDQLTKFVSLQASIHDMLNQPLGCDGGFFCNGGAEGKGKSGK